MNTDTVKVEFPTKGPLVISKGNVTVKIFRVKSAKNRDGCYYQVADYSQGPRKLISFADLGEAKEEAERIAKKQRKGDVYALGMGSPERAAYGCAMQRLEPIGISLEMASALFAEAVGILGDSSKLVDAAKFYVSRHPTSMPPKTVPELVKEMISVKAGRGKSKRYLQDLRSRLTRFATDFPCQGATVDTRSIQKWLDGLGLSPQSYVNYRTVIGGLFSFAEARGFIAKGTNPVEGVERLDTGDSDIAVFTPAEFAALLNASSREFLPALAIGGLAGLRSSEIQRLEWSDIDLPRRFVTVDASKAKTASRRVVPICDALAAWLKPFCGPTGLIWNGNDDGFANTQRRTARAAGLKWKSNALRHSYASYRLSELGDPARTAMELGNSPTVVHRHYKELVRPEEAKAWFSIMPAPAPSV
ncbi:MAG TPA: tyrosine-type recombinase/integrase [Verrucomicrobiae bacterium]|nr:tyrosine-type recombinase/integrase [Verrucomicrobiae bacterium]